METRSRLVEWNLFSSFSTFVMLFCCTRFVKIHIYIYHPCIYTFLFSINGSVFHSRAAFGCITLNNSLSMHTYITAHETPNNTVVAQSRIDVENVINGRQ